VERREGAGPWLWVASVAMNSTRFTDFSLRPGTTYAYRVRARSASSFSPWSNEAIVTTLAGP